MKRSECIKKLFELYPDGDPEIVLVVPVDDPEEGVDDQEAFEPDISASLDNVIHIQPGEFLKSFPGKDD